MLTAILAIIAAISSSVGRMVVAFKDKKFLETVPKNVLELWGNYIYFADRLPAMPYFGFFKNTRLSENPNADNLPYKVSTWLKADINNRDAWGTSDFGFKTKLLFRDKKAYDSLIRCFKVGCKFRPSEYHTVFNSCDKKDYTKLKQWLDNECAKKTNANTYLLGYLLYVLQKDFPKGAEQFAKFVNVKSYGFYAELKKQFTGMLDAGLRVAGVVGATEGVEKFSQLNMGQMTTLAGVLAITPQDARGLVDSGYLDENDLPDLLQGLQDLNNQYNNSMNLGGTNSGLTGGKNPSFDERPENVVSRKPKLPKRPIRANKNETEEEQNTKKIVLVSVFVLLSLFIYKFFIKK